MPGRYVVVGGGAVGATVAAQLHLAGTDVALVARGPHLAAMRAGGLRYLRPDGPRTLHLPFAAGPEEVTLRSDDVLVVAVKSQDTEAVIAGWGWQPVPDAGGAAAADVLPVVLMQNGLENARTALRRFTRVVDAVVLSGASHVRPGEVASPGSPLAGGFYLGDAPSGAGPDSVRVAADLRAAGFAVQVVPDIGRWKAGKLLANLYWNLDAIYRRSRVRRRLGDALVEEATAVLQAAGLDPYATTVPDELDRASFENVAVPGAKRAGSSTWQSLARGGGAEGDYLYGEIALLARLNGLRAPLNEAVQSRIATAARRGLRPRSLPKSDIVELLGHAGAGAPVAMS